MQCSNHVKQISLALHNHHDTRDTFPPLGGSLNKKFSTMATAGTVVYLMPFMEMSPLYDGLSGYKNDEYPAPWNAPIMQSSGLLSTLLCPSNGERRIANPGWIPKSYVFSMGDACWAQHSTNTSESYHVGSRGMFFYYNDGTSGTGRKVEKTLASCADGTSNTIAVSEFRTPATFDGTDSRSNVAVYTGIWDDTPWGRPGSCMTGLIMTDRYTFGSEHASNADFRGVIATCGWLSANGFTTLTPPNTPTCVYPVTANVHASERWGVFPPTSAHTGGVNIGLFDGSVRFVSDTVDCRDLNARAVKSGASPFGVWGALGSPDGGESQSLP
jgi:prepilin-type processing-associated H-X9-DG protein